MTIDYGDFACCSSAASRYHAIFREADVTNLPQDKMPLRLSGMRSAAYLNGISGSGQLTPSFFCRLDDDVVYWNTSRLSG